MSEKIVEKVLPPLPAEYAFVVQFGRDTDASEGRLVGQVEHLASARQGRFSNREELIAMLVAMLTGALTRNT
jgi:hypothetical protein